MKNFIRSIRNKQTGEEFNYYLLNSVIDKYGVDNSHDNLLPNYILRDESNKYSYTNPFRKAVSKYLIPFKPYQDKDMNIRFEVINSSHLLQIKDVIVINLEKPRIRRYNYKDFGDLEFLPYSGKPIPSYKMLEQVFSELPTFSDENVSYIGHYSNVSVIPVELADDNFYILKINLGTRDINDITREVFDRNMVTAANSEKIYIIKSFNSDDDIVLRVNPFKERLVNERDYELWKKSGSFIQEHGENLLSSMRNYEKYKDLTFIVDHNGDVSNMTLDDILKLHFKGYTIIGLNIETLTELYSQYLSCYKIVISNSDFVLFKKKLKEKIFS